MLIKHKMAYVILTITFLLLLPGITNAQQMSALEQLALTSPNLFGSILKDEQLVSIDKEVPGKPQFVTVITLFNAPINEVFSIVSDYNDYAKHIPQTTSVKVVQKNGNVLIVDYKVEFKFSILSEHANYTLKHVLNPPDSITWTRVAGNLKTVEGSWKFLPVDNGKKTIGFYRVYTDISSLSFLIRYMLEKQPILNTAISTSSALVYTNAIQKWVNEAGKH
ncbi:MAG: type II toxin-antitoxin system RatA family toxin [bacterium]